MDKTQYNSLVVRVAAPADAAALAALARELLEYERSLNEYAGELTPWAASPDEMRKQIQRPGVRFFVAERNNELVGYIKAVIYGQRPRRGESGTLLWLEDVAERAARRVFDFVMRRPRPNLRLTGGYIAGAFVRNEARRSSIGRALITAAEDWFRSHGMETSELHVLYANDGARRFWEEIGYEPLAMGMRKVL
ncbi:MAG TPA: GNAT family N-acetyltransferase [Blastocatellia bacterium]|nr:GNAT family N-acetyltransferase [Blastocatellia bacterium]